MVDTIRLKKLRCSEGFFTAAGFARALGMNEIAYRNRENGVVPFTAEEFIRICDALGISLESGVEILIKSG